MQTTQQTLTTNTTQPNSSYTHTITNPNNYYTLGGGTNGLNFNTDSHYYVTTGSNFNVKWTPSPKNVEHKRQAMSLIAEGLCDDDIGPKGWLLLLAIQRELSGLDS